MLSVSDADQSRQVNIPTRFKKKKENSSAIQKRKERKKSTMQMKAEKTFSRIGEAGHDFLQNAKMKPSKNFQACCSFLTWPSDVDPSVLYEGLLQHKQNIKKNTNK
ncbi:hypothetical protein CEXT_465851 [Caerostris extrusa]|uniref:Uncharacterized protein n=1 Tax=Caerostris extrusa TaxID=172846 RepID=A0AAV4PUY9_CAEEX|nr:hypothetical protein CEXT_465851 [Caerostris extrusa]